MVSGLKPRKAAIIAADDFEDLELFYPMYRLQEEGIETTVIGLLKIPLGERGDTLSPRRQQ